MPFELSPSEQLTYSVVRIECETTAGPSTGTGFFYRFLDQGDNHIPAIVTNKHVVNGSTRGRIHLTKAGEDGSPLIGEHFCIVIEGFEQQWIGHPDPSVDLCIMPIAPLLIEAKNAGHSFFFIGIDKSLISTPEELDELTAIEDIVMIGYPNGIWDSHNNMPIVRKGITATYPALDYENRREFMIDAACFPGSSGSPIFLFNLGGWSSRRGDLVIGSRIKLLGILYAGPQHTATGEIKIINIPTSQQPIALSRIPNNLGLVIKSSRLLEFENILQSKLTGS